MDTIKIFLSQQNVIVGDISGNLAKARDARALAGEADLVVLSELFLSGYPPEDLVLNRAFLEEIKTAVHILAAETSQGPACLIGAPWVEENKVYNAALLLENGRIAAVVRKRHLPDYAVFDESRLFSAGDEGKAVIFRGINLGIRICEDIWTDTPDTIDNADIIIVLNGSPFDIEKEAEKISRRFDYARAYAEASNAALIYLNQVGGQDELAFDGASFVIGRSGKVIVQAPAWQEAHILTQWKKTAEGWLCTPGQIAPLEQGIAAIWQAMMIGLRDYVEKNKFASVVLGLSGGIDSALVAVLAVDALGAERVHCVMMPSKFTSPESLRDARACAETLGVKLDEISIEPMVETTAQTLTPFFGSTQTDATEENIQSRLRGVILMALSNKFNHMLLSTGNKSEISVGYATLYGDMNGGFNPIKDIYKTRVFEAAQWRNENHPKSARGPQGVVIAPSIIDKPPSAELREGQKDEDSLPPYDVLDDILAALIDEDQGISEIVALGHDAALVKRIAHLVRVAEYKRRQAPPGVKISTRNFGRGRRYPITNHFMMTLDE